MNWSIALLFASGAVVAMLLISAYAHHFTDPSLQQGFAVLAGCVAMGHGRQRNHDCGELKRINEHR
jgi:hypothetical protein